MPSFVRYFCRHGLSCRARRRCSSSLGRRGMARHCKCVADDAKHTYAKLEPIQPGVPRTSLLTDAFPAQSVPQPLNPDVTVAVGGGEVCRNNTFHPPLFCTLPEGTAVHLRQRPGLTCCCCCQMVAVLQFSGYAVREAAAAARLRLIQALEYGAQRSVQHRFRSCADMRWCRCAGGAAVHAAISPLRLCISTKSCCLAELRA